jgi:hypothetical protein
VKAPMASNLPTAMVRFGPGITGTVSAKGLLACSTVLAGAGWLLWGGASCFLTL